MICEVCNVNKAEGVYASQLGPCSHAICSECLNNYAECFSVVEYTSSLLEDGLLESQIYADRLKHVSIYKDGQYIKWTDYIKS